MIIYKTTNLVNGKIYIGQDSNNNPNYYGSGTLLHKAIKKYGKDQFMKEIIEHCNSKTELNKRETYWIQQTNSQNTDIGYNITSGGDGIDSELARKLIKKQWSDPNSKLNSLDTKNKIRKATTNNHRDPMSTYNTSEYHDKLKESHNDKAPYQSVAFSNKMSNIKREQWSSNNSVYKSDKYKRNHGESHTSTEFRQKQRDRQLKLMANPDSVYNSAEYKEKQMTAHTSEEYKQKLRNSWTPERRELASIRIKLYWQNKKST